MLHVTSVKQNTHSPQKVKPRPRRLNTKAVRIRLIQKGWSMTELAKRVGLARQYVSQIVHGKQCRPAAAARIARVLGMKP